MSKTNVTTKNEKTEAKQKKERKPLSVLTGDVKAQYDAVAAASQAYLKAVTEAKLVPGRHLYELGRSMNQQTHAIRKQLRGDARTRKRVRLLAQLSKVKQLLVDLDNEAQGEQLKKKSA